jgi:hypothetical protein
VDSTVDNANFVDISESLLQVGQKVVLQKNVQGPRIQSLICLLQNAGQERNKTIVNRTLEIGFGGLVISMLTSGTQIHGFKPCRSRRIFRAKKSSARLPSEGK